MKKLKRALYPMTDYIEKALLDRELMDTYLKRPPYQRNDYIGWIIRAKQEKTKQKRLNQMLDELTAGDCYMNIKYRVKEP